MKKYINFFSLCFVILLLCSGCDGDVTRALRHDGFNVGTTDFKCDALTGSGFEKIKFYAGNTAITDTGRVYDISLSQRFQNNENCKSTELSVKVVAVFDNRVFKGDDGRLYYLVSDNTTEAYSQVTNSDNSYYLYELLLKPEGTVKVMTADSTNGIYYVLKSDGNVYGYSVNSSNRNAAPSIVGTVVVYDKNDYGGNIIDFNYVGESAATYVRSDSKVFRMRATNAEECSQYADVKCDFQMVESEVFSEYGDKILAFNGSTLITTYGKIFTTS